MRSNVRSLCFVVLVAAIVQFGLSGCGKKDDVSMKANAICEAYTVKMEAGQTTPEQDKEYIKAVNEVVFQLDRAIRGQKKAQATRDSAKLAATTGVDPKAPLKLFEEEVKPELQQGQ